MQFIVYLGAGAVGCALEQGVFKQVAETGAEVIALQAAEQFERYTGVRPTAEQVAEASAISRA